MLEKKNAETARKVILQRMRSGKILSNSQCTRQNNLSYRAGTKAACIVV